MADTKPPPSAPTPDTPEQRAAEEALFYHEAELNAVWTGSRLAMGGLSFLFGAFLFAYFYLRSQNSNHLWHPAGQHATTWLGTVIMALIVVSAAGQTLLLQRLKHGDKATWQRGGVVALLVGLAAIAMQIWELLHLSFWPGSSGFASVFVGFYPVFLTIAFCAMIWLEILLVRALKIPAIAFVEQPPTYDEAFTVQRFQASLSAFTAVWNYLAVVGILFWVLFYLF